MIHFLVPQAGAWSVEDYLARDRPELAARFRVLYYERLPDTEEFPPGVYVLSGLDQLEGAGLALVQELHQRLSGRTGFRFLNHPTETLRRLPLLTELARTGDNDFHAVRPDADLAALRYPVFLRGDREHRGPLSPLLHTAREVNTAIGRAVIRGYALDDLLIVEFCDTRGTDGLYRKYSAFIVGDRIHGRCLEHGPSWMVKFDAASFNPETVREERDYVTANPHAAMLAPIFRRARVEYGRIDYAVAEGRFQTWEINLNATIGRGTNAEGGVGPRELFPIRDESREFFFDRFREAWETVDLLPPAPPVRLQLAGAAAARAEGPRNQRRPAAGLQDLLRPFKGLIEPVSAPLLRLVARLAKRRKAG